MRQRDGSGAERQHALQGLALWSYVPAVISATRTFVRPSRLSFFHSAYALAHPRSCPSSRIRRRADGRPGRAARTRRDPGRLPGILDAACGGGDVSKVPEFSSLEVVGYVVNSVPLVAVPVAAGCVVALCVSAPRPQLAWRAAGVVLGAAVAVTMLGATHRLELPIRQNTAVGLSGLAFVFLVAAAVARVVVSAASRLS
jgi:hypothetical protein